MNIRMKFLRRYVIGSGIPPIPPVPVDTFTYFELDDSSVSTELYTGVNTTPTVPDTYNGNSVLWVGDKTFSGNTDITSVTISNGIEQIK